MSRSYDLLNMIASYPMLRQGAEAIRLRGELPGIDGRTYYSEIQAPGINDYLRKIGHALKEGRYEFSALRRVTIPKTDGGRRTLDIPTIHDRVVESTIATILYEWCSPTWSDTSMGFRRGISHQDVMITMDQLSLHDDQIRTTWLSTDIADAFGSIPHAALLEIVAKEIPHQGLQKLIRDWLKTGTWTNQKGQKTRGIAQGSPLSPFMLNLYLNHVLDQKLEAKGIPFIRYADDLLLPCKDEQEAEARLDQIKKLLQPWGLKLKESKTVISDATKESIPYIGFLASIKDDQLKLDIDSQRHIQKLSTELNLRAQINGDCRSYAIKLEDQAEQARMVIEGWLQHFAPGISSGKLTTVIKGIKTTLIDLNISGIHSSWIKEIWNRSRDRWEARKAMRSNRTPDRTGNLPCTKRASRSSRYTEKIGTSEKKAAERTKGANAPNEGNEHLTNPPWARGTNEMNHSYGSCHGSEPRSRGSQEATTGRIDLTVRNLDLVSNPDQNAHLEAVLDAGLEASLEEAVPCTDLEVSPRAGFEAGLHPGLEDGLETGSETDPRADLYDGLEDDLEADPSQRKVPHDGSIEYDAARGMNKNVVQHAALWLFDGLESLPTPVVVLDSSAPRRPGPMERDWALRVAQ